MQRWQGARITHPLAESESSGGDHMASEQMTGRTSNVAEAPTVRMRTVPPAVQPAPAAARANPSEPAEMARIREILVGPHMRDHERRLRALEQRLAGPAGSELSAEWRAQVEEALARVRQARDEQDQAHAFAVAQLNAQISRQRDERDDFLRAFDAMRAEQQALRAELERERQAREELAAIHARAISELAKQLDHESESHLRLHARLSTELDARLERERQAYADELRLVAQAHANDLRRMEAEQAEALRSGQSAQAELRRRLDETHGVRAEALQELVAEAERALTTMQAERQYLAGLLAELGLHLVRHAASPAASRAAEAAEAFFEARGES